MILGLAEIHYSNSDTVDLNQQAARLAPITDGPVAVDWTQGSAIDLEVGDLEKSAESKARFVEVPAPATKPKNLESWKKDLSGWIFRYQRLELFESPSLNIVSNPGEDERQFRIRLQQFSREKRDEAVEKLRQKYAPKIAALEEKKRRAEQTVEREAQQATAQKVQTAISFGATLLSSFMGRKSISMSTLGRATTAARGVGRTMKESQDVGRAEESVASITQQLADLDAQFKEETSALETSVDPKTEKLEKVSLKPTKTNISVKLLTLCWAPYWQDSQGQATPAWE
jgi:hypothetical protein